MALNNIYITGFLIIVGFCGNFDDSVDAVALLGCKHHNLKLLQILGYVCNSTQPSVQFRDACNGCFLRAVALPNGPPQLIAISQCSAIYFSNSTYRICSEGLASHILSVKPIIRPILPTVTITCQTGYCEFVRCVRRVNSYNLINGCFTLSLVDRDFNKMADRVAFYTNATACILARARCSDVNPITGDLQRQPSSLYPPGITNGVGEAGFYHFNALQIARNGDLKIVAFPSTYVLANRFCSVNISLRQSSHSSSMCAFN